ncbi:uncharacterized protein LOC119731182 [Patiria miniata]|uniref:Superoxide dismutase copper/zinc binding domain-containing protein n=1 Tax=Patiria miniata TaxID=46514 RepID=A0A914A9R3_PATMI|nr:uncharacterized protein LOC119731182 [Patiria miniata]
MASLSWLSCVLALLGVVVAVNSAPFINQPYDEPTDLEIQAILKYLHLEHPVDELEALEDIEGDGITTKEVEGERRNDGWSTMLGKETTDLDFAETTVLEANSRENVVGESSEDAAPEVKTADAGSQVKTGSQEDNSKLEGKDSETDSKGPAFTMTDLKSVIVHVISTESDKAPDTNPESEQVSETNTIRDHGSFADFLKAQVARKEELQKQAQEAEDEELGVAQKQGEGVSTAEKTTAEEDNLSKELHKLDPEGTKEWGDPVKDLEDLTNPRGQQSTGNDVDISSDDNKDAVATAKEFNNAPLDLPYHDAETDNLENEHVLDGVMMWEKAQLSKQRQSLASLANNFQNHVQEVDDTISEEENEYKEQADMKIGHVGIDGEKISQAAEPEQKQVLAEKDALDKPSHVGAKGEGGSIKETARADSEEMKEKTSESLKEGIAQADLPIQSQEQNVDVTDKDVAQAPKTADTKAESEADTEDVKQVVSEVGSSDTIEGAVSLENYHTGNLNQKVESSDTDLTQEVKVAETNAKLASGNEAADQSSKPNDQQVDQEEQVQDSKASPLKYIGNPLDIPSDRAVNDHEIVSQLMLFLKKMNKELELGAADGPEAGQSMSFNLEKMPAQVSKTSEGYIPQRTAVTQDSMDQNDNNMGTAAGKEVQSKSKDAIQNIQEDVASDIAANAASVSQEVAKNDKQRQAAADIDKIADAGDNFKAFDKEVDINTKADIAENQGEIKAILDASHKTEHTDEKVPNANAQTSSGSVLDADVHHDNVNDELSDETLTTVKVVNNNKAAGEKDGVDVDITSKNVKVSESSESRAKTPGESMKEVNSNEESNQQQHPSGVEVSGDDAQVEQEDEAKAPIEGHELSAVVKDSTDAETAEVDSASLTREGLDEGKGGAVETKVKEVEVLPVDEKTSKIGEEINKEGGLPSPDKNLEEKIEASDKGEATGDVQEKEVVSGKENKANDLVPSKENLSKVQETEESKAEESNHGNGVVMDASRVQVGTPTEKDMDAEEAAVANGQTLAKNHEVDENQGVTQLKEEPTFEGNDKNELAMKTEVDNEGAVSDSNAHADPSLDNYEFARCDLQANNIPYAPLAVKNHVTGQIVFKQKKSGGSMEIKAGLYGLATDGPMEHAIDVHEYGDLSNGCESTGMRYTNWATEVGQTTSIGKSDVLGTVQRDETGNVRSAWTAESGGLVGEHSILGRAVVVHAVRYDSSPNSEENGTKLACCVVARSSDVTPWI